MELKLISLQTKLLNWREINTLNMFTLMLFIARASVVIN